MGTLSIWHWVVVLVVVLLLFGKGKIPALMGDVAKGIKAFKAGIKDDSKKISDELKTVSGEGDEKPIASEEKDEVSSKA
jgi:sec-independent protein translocase protein TatA